MNSYNSGIAVSLGSSFLGYYTHSGFLSGLNEIGIEPGHISGASAGAMAGGLYAAGLQGDALKNAVMSRKLMHSYPDAKMLIRWIPMFLTGRVTGVLSGKGTVKHLKKILPVQAIEDCTRAKLSVAVTDLRNFQSHFLTKGNLAESIMASCAVPILFNEQVVDGQKYYDGGILHETPMDHFLEDPSIHTIVVHRISFPKEIRRTKRFTLPEVMATSHYMLCDELMRYRVKEAALRGKRLIQVTTEHKHPGLIQTQVAKKMFYSRGFDTALELQNILKESPAKLAQ